MMIAASTVDWSVEGGGGGGRGVELSSEPSKDEGGEKVEYHSCMYLEEDSSCKDQFWCSHAIAIEKEENCSERDEKACMDYEEDLCNSIVSSASKVAEVHDICKAEQ